jgi:enoyl-CoA hydratase/carnithine racemase
VVAAINGHAVAGDACSPLACDLRVSAGQRQGRPEEIGSAPARHWRALRFTWARRRRRSSTGARSTWRNRHSSLGLVDAVVGEKGHGRRGGAWRKPTFRASRPSVARRSR